MMILGIPLDVAWRLFLVGAGLGPSQSLFNLVAQSAAPIRQIGVATSTSMFLRQTGGLIGVSIFGAMMTAKLTERLAPHMPPGNESAGYRPDERHGHGPAGRRRAPMKIPPFIAEAFSDAMSYIFTGSLFIIAIAFVTIFFIPQITLRGRAPQQTSSNKGLAEAESALADAAPSPADPAPMRDAAEATD